MEELASAFSVDRRTVGNHLKRRRVTTKARKLTAAQIAEAVELYRAGWSVRRLGARFGVHGESIRYRLVRAGVQLRPRPGPHG
jgi:DNA-binding transcriptional ArsR family regulator